MEQSPNLRLPYLMPSQAQKHVTHNDALRTLDAVVQVGVISKNLSAPPASPQEGNRYIVATGATGGWAGKDNRLAAWIDNAWMFHDPAAGWLAWIGDEARLQVWNGSSWMQAAVASVNPVGMVGVNATADATNRLAVKADASLFSHDDVTPGTGNHQLVVNKGAAANTGSMVWQTGFSGRAEIGLAGDDKLRVKVSPNGSAWTDAVTIDNATGKVGVGVAAPGELLSVGKASVNNDLSLSSSTNMKTFLGAAANNCVFAINRKVADGAFTNAGLPTASFGFYISSGNSEIRFGTANANNVLDTMRLVIDKDGHTKPAADNAYSLGLAGARFKDVWAVNGTIQTSDLRQKALLKNGRKKLEKIAPELVKSVAPILFRWKDGGNDIVASTIETEPDAAGNLQPKMVAVARPGQRVHTGFAAQDVRAAMLKAGIDFGAWGLVNPDDPASEQWLRPDQLIPVLWEAVRQLQHRIGEIERSSNHPPEAART